MSSSAYSSCTSRKNSSSNSTFSTSELVASMKSKKLQPQKTIMPVNKLHRPSFQTSDYSSATNSLDLNESAVFTGLPAASSSTRAAKLALLEHQKKLKKNCNRTTTTDSCAATPITEVTSSGQRARLLSLVLQSPRRFSCNSDSGTGFWSSGEQAHPFWVPPEILERSKPRSSLPNTHVSEINEAMLGLMHHTVTNLGKLFIIWGGVGLLIDVWMGIINRK